MKKKIFFICFWLSAIPLSILIDFQIVQKYGQNIHLYRFWTILFIFCLVGASIKNGSRNYFRYVISFTAYIALQVCVLLIPELYQLITGMKIFH